MGLQIIKPDTKIDFIGFKRTAFMVSALLILLGLGSLIMKGGPKYGIDFAGGIVVQVKFDKKLEVKEVKSALKGTKLPGLVVQSFGHEDDNEILIRTSTSKVSSADVRTMISDDFTKNLSGTGFEIQRFDMVGPKVGADLRTKAIEALYFAVLLIAIYISGRFEKRWFAAAIMAGGLFAGISALQLLGMSTTVLIFAALIITVGLCWYLRLNYALGAIVALIHDLIITVGIFSLLDKEFDLTIIAALLTIIGYSLNDTIIVFDRIRENLLGKISDSMAETINISINQTLSRTILTSGTTLLVVAALFALGGGVIHDFALALLVGVGVGTYSSIFVASPILLGFGPGKAEEDDDTVGAETA
ncbi:protein translocase subunit SecF [Maridesulfovibrio hydrothermalis]|uniref:Protein-export membrane protein SecF n=1 Tax=Maridesulfovibrio hydrothermalis AM13 = DSM 14728 TaxID=1121451 RepID=L0RC41_9BACT|nr:protein translocase subunit SecF [Maridesulfovibrio hydrothermalis]CCO24319.1 Protein translocase subunit SecF [Maridesulfovibrio hydrothermalis AM13 = DSM 14728]